MLPSISSSETAISTLLQHFTFSPISTSLSTLRTLSSSCQQELIQVINSRYQDFIHLANSLQGIDLLLTELLSKLENKQQEVERIVRDLMKCLNNSTLLYNKRKLIINQQSVALEFKMMLELRDRMSAPKDTLALVRSARDLRYLQSSLAPFTRDSRDYAFINQLTPQISSFKSLVMEKSVEALKAELEHIIQDSDNNSNNLAFSTPNNSTLSSLLFIFHDLDQMDACLSVLDNVLISPFLTTLQPSLPFTQVLTRLFAFTHKHLVPISLTLHHIHPKNYLLIIFDKFNGFLLKSWGDCFLVGQNLHQFHDDYHSYLSYCHQFEQLLDPGVLGCSTVYKDGMKKWQVSVYCQLYHNELICTFISALEPTETALADPNLVKASLLSCLSGLWDPKRAIKVSSHRSWKLFILMIHRYFSWIHKYLESMGDDKLNIENIENDKVQSHLSVSNPTNLESSIPKLFTLFNHISSIKTYCFNLMTNDISTFLFDMDKQSSTTRRIQESMMDAIDSVFSKTPLDNMQQTLVSALVSTCVEPLLQCTNIPGVFRRTGKPIPTLPSFYMRNVFASIQEMFGISDGRLDKSVEKELIEKIVIQTVSIYTTTVTKTLVSIKNVEESLKKFKRRKATNSNEVNEVSDEYKMRMQFLIDLDALDRQMGQFIDGKVDAFVECYELVKTSLNDDV